ncbi:MAG TPA: hypothetical protein VGF59_28375 [Bryobacteraceae bacterium]|jgi:hypothetical protein
MPKIDNSELLAAALYGYERQRSELDAKIADIRRQLRGTPSLKPAATPETAHPRKRRKMSRAARKRIAAAQKKRWAEFRKNKAGV